MQVTFPLGFSSFYLCIGRIKDFEVHSCLFCFSCVLVSSSEKALLPECRRTCPVQSFGGDFVRCKWILPWFCQWMFAELVPTAYRGGPGTQWMSHTLVKIRSLVQSWMGLRVLILAIRPWKGWPKYKAMHTLLLCLTPVLPAKAQVSRAAVASLVDWPGMKECFNAVGQRRQCFIFWIFKMFINIFCTIIDFLLQCRIFIILTLIQRICMACSFRQKESGIWVSYFG